MQRLVVAHKYLPSRFPVIGTALWLHLLDYYNCPGWAWGVSITLLVIIWIVVLIAIVTQKQVKPSEVL